MEAGASSLQGDSWMKGHERTPARTQVLSRKKQEALPPPYTAASWVQIQGGCGGPGPLPTGPLQHRGTHTQPYPRSIYRTPPHRGCRAQPLDSNQPASPRPLRPNGSSSRRASPAGGRQALWLPRLTTFPPAPPGSVHLHHTRASPLGRAGAALSMTSMRPPGQRRSKPCDLTEQENRSGHQEGSSAGSVVKKPPANAADTGLIPGRQVLAWEIPWTEEPAGQSPWGCRVRCN